MYFDHIADEKHKTNFGIWVQTLLRGEPEKVVSKLAIGHRSGTVQSAKRWKNGAYNVCYVVIYEDGFKAIVRFAALGRAIWRTEKVEDEVTVMLYIKEHTQIRVPKVLGWGTCWAGPYIMEDFVEGDALSEALKEPDREGRSNLNPHIDEVVLKNVYREMAKLVLEMSKQEFPLIGSLVRRKSGKFEVGRRPLTHQMNELASGANLGPEDLPSSTFDSSRDYFESLAYQHLDQFRKQRNDAFTDELDCQKKFVSRCMFKRIAAYMSREHSSGPFRLFCDDLRPANILANLSSDNIRINAVIDWEFTYAAPAEFSYVAPWWLLLQGPEDWEKDLREFLVRYTPRLNTFLEVLRECENERIINGTLVETQRLSGHMEASMESGLFWVCIAARHSQMFDDIYWTFLDEKFFGPLGSLDDRIKYLSVSEKEELATIFEVKKEQAKDGTIELCYTPSILLDL